VLHGFAEVAGNVGHRREKEISKVVPFETFTRLESILEKPGEQRLFFR